MPGPRVDVACSRCGEVHDKSVAMLRRSERKYGAYVCHGCACKPPPKKAVKVTDLKYPVTCPCGATMEIGYNKWRISVRKGGWSCRSCAHKAAYADGRFVGTRGMKFVEVPAEDELKRRLHVRCPVCSEVREVSVEAVAVACNVSTSVKVIGAIAGTVDAPFTHPSCRCLKCASVEVGLGLRSNTEEFVAKAVARHGDRYDYSGVDYTTTHERVSITCRDHGTFELKPTNHLHGQGCPTCAFTVTKPMQAIIDHVAAMGFDSLVNDRKVIAPLELDIVIPERKLAIEFHGLYWHSYPQRQRDKLVHKRKWEEAKSAGYRLIQVFEDEWSDRRELVLNMISHRLGSSAIRLYARKCELQEVSPRDAREFFGVNHVQGADRPKVAFALISGGVTVACASFYRPPISGGDRKVDWLISRFACKNGLAVVGAFSRLFTGFVRTHSPLSVGSYADLRWGDGEVYASNGFGFSHVTAPGYSYYDMRNGKLERKHRFGFRKSRLAAIMGDDFRPEETEAQNAIRLGLGQIYDAGNAYYVWRRSDRQFSISSGRRH